MTENNKNNTQADADADVNKIESFGSQRFKHNWQGKLNALFQRGLNGLGQILLWLLLKLWSVVAWVLGGLGRLFFKLYKKAAQKSPRLLAWQELAERYTKNFKYNWENRAQMGGNRFTKLEGQFLPSALALQETPISPAPLIAIRCLLALIIIAIIWAIFGQIDIVASAQGKVIATGHTKIIQPLEAASVTAIYVSDGQYVKVGDRLMDLDASIPIADKERLESELFGAQLQAARAQAMLAAIKVNAAPKLIAPPDMPKDKVAESERQIEGLYIEYASRRTRVEADISKAEAEVFSAKQLLKKYELTLPLTAERATDMKRLMQEGYIAKHQYLEREQAYRELQGDLATQRSRLQESQSILVATRAAKEALYAETQRVALDSLNEAQQKISSIRPELSKAMARGNLMKLVAPVDGMVQQLAIHTIGGVVTPAQALMMIVPNDAEIEVEAFVENKDIGFVHIGQEAEVKIETFQYTKYGFIHGKVVNVTLDALNDDKNQNNPATAGAPDKKPLLYAIKVQLEKATMDVDGQLVKLNPGMAVIAEIKTGKRRVIEYFLSPLFTYKNESLRER